MALYRHIQTSFWRDSFITELTPMEKYFYLYLMSNINSTQCGIFELPIKIMEVETDLDKDTISSLINKFESCGKILYDKDNQEIMIVKWAKYNFTSSKNTLICINRELKNVKTKRFLNKMYELCVEYGYDINEIFKNINIDDISINTEQQSEARDLNDDEDFKEVIDVFNNNIHPITPFEYERLQDWSKDFECEVIKKAIDEAVLHNARTMTYINGILNNWLSMGLRSIKAVNAYMRDYCDKKDRTANRNGDIQNSAAYVVIED